MKLDEALPSIFRRARPLVERGTRMVVAGTLAGSYKITLLSGSV